MFFDRYTTDTRQVRKALDKSDMAYCDPINYNVTEEDCLKYLEEVKSGQEKNKIWNTNRKNRVVKTTLILCFVISIILFIVSLFFLHIYAEGWEIGMLPITWIIIGGAIGVYNWVEEKYISEYIWRSDYFPPINDKIEKLFDDYLWKKYLREEESKKQNRSPQIS
jgi:hypothetical protein